MLPTKTKLFSLPIIRMLPEIRTHILILTRIVVHLPAQTTTLGNYIVICPMAMVIQTRTKNIVMKAARVNILDQVSSFFLSYTGHFFMEKK